MTTDLGFTAGHGPASDLMQMCLTDMNLPCEVLSRKMICLLHDQGTLCLLSRKQERLLEL